jgi:PIN like domain
LALDGQNLLMHGLYDGEFVGFKIASSEQLDAALREAVVAVDANVLLDLYRFRPQTSQDLIKTLKSLGDRLDDLCKGVSCGHETRVSMITV